MTEDGNYYSSALSVEQSSSQRIWNEVSAIAGEGSLTLRKRAFRRLFGPFDDFPDFIDF